MFRTVGNLVLYHVAEFLGAAHRLLLAPALGVVGIAGHARAAVDDPGQPVLRVVAIGEGAVVGEIAVVVVGRGSAADSRLKPSTLCSYLFHPVLVNLTQALAAFCFAGQSIRQGYCNAHRIERYGDSICRHDTYYR